MAEACALLAAVVLLFAAAIVVCATTGVSVVFALCFGFFVFTGYGLFKGFTLRALFPMMMKGVKATAGIVIVMGLIGMLTGSWRASGTIARLVGDASGFISPAWSLTTVFLINGAVSTLLGTSFGTAATLGVISMTMTNAMGVDPFLAGGAVLAGVFVGDRCSPSFFGRRSDSCFRATPSNLTSRPSLPNSLTSVSSPTSPRSSSSVSCSAKPPSAGP